MLVRLLPSNRAMDLQRIPVRFRIPADGLPLVQSQFADSSIDVLSTGEQGARELVVGQFHPGG